MTMDTATLTTATLTAAAAAWTAAWAHPETPREVPEIATRRVMALASGMEPETAADRAALAVLTAQRTT